MARIKNNPLVKGASGKVARDIVYKTYYDKTVISKVPDMSKRKLSEKQKDWNRRLESANAFAGWVYETEERKMKARIRLKLPAHKSLFHGLVKEWLDRSKLSIDEAVKFAMSFDEDKK